MRSRKLKNALDDLVAKMTGSGEAAKDEEWEKFKAAHNPTAERYNGYWDGFYKPVLDRIKQELGEKGVDIDITETTSSHPGIQPDIKGAAVKVPTPQGPKKITIDGIKHPEQDRFDVRISGEGIKEVKVIDTFHGDESLQFEDAIGEIIDSYLKA